MKYIQLVKGSDQEINSILVLIVLNQKFLFKKLINVLNMNEECHLTYNLLNYHYLRRPSLVLLLSFKD